MREVATRRPADDDMVAFAVKLNKIVQSIAEISETITKCTTTTALVILSKKTREDDKKRQRITDCYSSGVVATIQEEFSLEAVDGAAAAAERSDDVADRQERKKVV